MLLARGKERDKINGLNAGADDYLTKPYAVNELNARLRAVLRWAVWPGTKPVTVHEWPELKLGPERRRVWREGREVHLTPLEFKLLARLALNAGKAVTHNQLLRAVWGGTTPEQAHYPRLYVHQLRHKLKPDPARSRFTSAPSQRWVTACWPATSRTQLDNTPLLTYNFPI